MSPEKQDMDSRSTIQTCGWDNRVSSNTHTTCQGAEVEGAFGLANLVRESTPTSSHHMGNVLQNTKPVFHRNGLDGKEYREHHCFVLNTTLT